MSKTRILFLGTPDFAVASLEHLIHDDRFEIVGVISQPDRPAGRKMQLKASPVKELALQHGLPVFTPETVNTEEFRQQILKLSATSAVVVAFGQILGQKFLDLFPQGCVNVHGSVLPRWRGAAPIQRAIMEGDSESGVALQMIVKKLDAGPVLGIRRVAIPDLLDAPGLYEQLKMLGAQLLTAEYVDYLRGHLHPVAQDESGVTIAPKIEKLEAKIDWQLPARVIFNQVRGLQMGPFAFALRNGQMLKIHKSVVSSVINSGAVSAVIDEGGASAQPGRVTVRGSGATAQLIVACGTGSLEILEVQPESRARMSVTDYLRGYPMTTGESFET